MSRCLSSSAVAIAALLAAAGLARTVSAINIAPPSVYLWTGHNYGAGAGNAPGAVSYNGAPGTPVWTWNDSSMSSQPWIDSSGRIYATGAFSATPGVANIDPSFSVYGQFTASSGINNSPDLNLYQNWATGQTDPNTGYQLTNNDGTSNGLSPFSTLRVSGTSVGLGVRIGNPLGTPPGTGVQEFDDGIGPTALLQNNTQLYTGNFGSQTHTARQGSVLAVPNSNDWTAIPSGTVNVNNSTDYRSDLSQQFSDMNTSGTWLMPVRFATEGPNPATPSVFASGTDSAATGNASALALVTPTGSTTIIARCGDLPFGPGGPQFVNGSNGNFGANGVGGYFMKMARNGQVAYDAGFLNVGLEGQPGPGGVTSTNDSSAWIYTPGSGSRATQNTQIYQESLNVPTHVDPISGLATSNGSATQGGGINTSGSSFSNAGILYTTTPEGGDTTFDPNISNAQFTMISTVASGMTPTWVMRQNDIAPGFSAASNVHIGAVNTSSLHINNSGRVAFGAQLQSTSTAAVQPHLFPDIDFFGSGNVLTPGIQGNDGAVFAGLPGITGPTGLKVIARTGDLAPGMGGARLSIETGNLGMNANNRGDVVFLAGLTSYAPGDIIGVVGEPAPPFNPTQVLYAWNESYGLVNLLSTGQLIELETGVFKYINQFGAYGVDNGDGGSMTLNDNGQLVVWLRLADSPDPFASATSTAYVVLQVPAAGTGSLALLGVGIMARRRRR